MEGDAVKRTMDSSAGAWRMDCEVVDCGLGNVVVSSLPDGLDARYTWLHRSTGSWGLGLLLGF